jgi:hypothetical protein
VTASNDPVDNVEANSMKSKIAVASVVTVALLALTVGSITFAPRSVTADPGKVTLVENGVALEKTPGVSVEQVATEGERNMLQVNNNTPFIIIVYIGGIRIGWMRPYRTGLIRGLMTGYHRLYAHSQYGTTSWGPRDAWIPGTWNLLY